jgi:signal transduction histidine kinase
MIRQSSLRWRLVAGFVATMLVVLAVVFVLVYEQTGSQLQARTDSDVHGDVTQLAEATRTLRAGSAAQVAAGLSRYIQAQPYSATSSLLFAVIPGHQAISNHPELLSLRSTPDRHETRPEQDREIAQSRALRSGAAGQRTAIVSDLGPARIDEQTVTIAGVHVRLGAGESLQNVSRAQHAVARTFLLAGGVGLALVLIGAYLAGALISRPLRRMARVAAQVTDGDFAPRMAVSPAASREIRVLARSFNHMLDRLAFAFANERAFVADASHELRTPLTVIAGQFEVLAAEVHPSMEEIRRTQRLISAEIARISRLIDDMLLLTRSEHADFLRRGRFQVAPFVTDLWATTTAGRERRFELAPVPDGQLDADPDRLAQALRNLIENAIVHTEEPDGLVALSIEPLPGGWIRLAVEDDGPGIPEGERERVFERFHRTDQARDRVSGGAGLGLSIVRAIAHAHRGRVRATERAEGGARLELELPGYRPAPRAHADTRPTSADARPSLGRAARR